MAVYAKSWPDQMFLLLISYHHGSNDTIRWNELQNKIVRVSTEGDIHCGHYNPKCHASSHAKLHSSRHYICNRTLLLSATLTWDVALMVCGQLLRDGRAMMCEVLIENTPIGVYTTWYTVECYSLQHMICLLAMAVALASVEFSWVSFFALMAAVFAALMAAVFAALMAAVFAPLMDISEGTSSGWVSVQ